MNNKEIPNESNDANLSAADWEVDVNPRKICIYEYSILSANAKELISSGSGNAHNTDDLIARINNDIMLYEGVYGAEPLYAVDYTIIDEETGFEYVGFGGSKDVVFSIKSDFETIYEIANERRDGYDLAKIAEMEDVDLSVMTREEYIIYAVKNRARIMHDRISENETLRVARNEEALKKQEKVLRSSMSPEAQQSYKALADDGLNGKLNYWLDGLDAKFYGKDTWFFINNIHADSEKSPVKTKVYLTFNSPSDFDATEFLEFAVKVHKLRHGYSVKIPVDEATFTQKHDQVVIHDTRGLSVDIIKQLAGEHFGEKLRDITEGFDIVENSYSAILDAITWVSQRLQDGKEVEISDPVAFVDESLVLIKQEQVNLGLDREVNQRQLLLNHFRNKLLNK